MDEKEKNLVTADYVKAAHIVANCSKARLPMVLEILRQGGIEIQQGAELQIVRTAEDAKRNWLKEKREAEGKEEVGYPGDETWVWLKRAYDEGISLIELSKKTGIHKTALYHFLHGEKNIRSRRELLESTIKEMLGVSEPPTQTIPFWEEGE